MRRYGTDGIHVWVAGGGPKAPGHSVTELDAATGSHLWPRACGPRVVCNDCAPAR
jgi:hypothetical protein